MARLSYIVTIIGIALICVLAEELYSDKFDSADSKSILEDNTLREQFINCYFETSPCVTEHQKFFKEIFSEAIQTNCRRCNELRKKKIDMIKDWFIKNNPKQWEAMVAKSKEDMEKKNAGR